MAEDVLWGDLGGEVSPSPLCTFLSPSRGCGEPGWVFALLLSWWICVCPGHGWHWLRENSPRQVGYLVGWDRTKLDSAASVVCPGKAGLRRRSCTVVMLGHSEGSCWRVGALRAQHECSEPAGDSPCSPGFTWLQSAQALDVSAELLLILP